MSTLTELVKNRRSSGESVTQSLIGGVKERLKEKLDPRRFFNQRGILVALFPKLKAYSSSGSPKVGKSKSKIKDISPSSDMEDPTLNRIKKNTEIFAINSNSLSGISRDVNVLRHNFQKLALFVTGKSNETTDAFFLKEQEREKLFESKFAKERARRLKEKIDESNRKSKKKRFSWLTLLGVAGATGAGFLIMDFFMNKEESLLKKMYKDLSGPANDLMTNGISYLDEVIDGTVTPVLNEYTDILSESINQLIDSIDKEFTLSSLVDRLSGDKSLTDFDLSAKTEELRIGMGERFSKISIFPEAQAATMPSMMFTEQSVGDGQAPSRIPIPGRGRLTDLVVAGESGRGPEAYNAVNYAALNAGFQVTSSKKMTEMTIGEVLEMQKTMPKSSAVGRYQIIQETLRGAVDTLGLPLTQRFDEQTQDRIFNEVLIGSKRQNLSNFIQGKSDNIDAAMLDLSKEFASMPVPYNVTRPRGAGGRNDPGGQVMAGQSYYHGLVGNRANKTINEVRAALLSERGSVSNLQGTVVQPLTRNSETTSNIMDASSELMLDEQQTKIPAKVSYVDKTPSADTQGQPKTRDSKESLDPLRMLVDNIA